MPWSFQVFDNRAAVNTTVAGAKVAVNYSGGLSFAAPLVIPIS